MATTIKAANGSLSSTMGLQDEDRLNRTSTELKTSWYPGKSMDTTSNTFEKPLLLTQEATDLDLALEELAKVCKRLCDQLDDLTSNIKKLTEENERLKDALGIVESSPMEDLEAILKSPLKGLGDQQILKNLQKKMKGLDDEK